MKTILMATVVVLFGVGCLTPSSQSSSIGQKQSPQAVPEPVPVIKELRNHFLTSKPEEFGFSQQDSKPVAWGILMEMGYPRGLATLVSLRDGNASLYLGHGGGVIGGIGHEKVRKAATGFTEEAEKFVSGMNKTESFPYPAVGRVRFYVLTFNGVMTAEAEEEELGEGKHKLSPLFYSGHEVLTQLRLSESEKRE